ncbi:hypothetical protein [Pseudomonas kurunegalensis]|uniref:hypothetical protein n=1 Tax=Pseudomonas kurunegalensis TaxID=485880 RepID=UPI003A8B028E
MHTIRRTTKSQASISAKFGAVSVPIASERDMKIANYTDKNGRPLIDYWISALVATLAPNGSGIRDRRQGSLRWMTTNSGILSVVDGKLSLDGSFILSAGEAATANLSAFTLIAKAKATASGSTIIGSELNSIAGTGSVSVGLSGVLTSAGGEGNVADNAGSLVGQEVVVSVTFSTERGVTIRRNGVQTYANPSRNKANIGGQVRIGGTGSSTTRFTGSIDCLLYSTRDLSAPELFAGLVALEKQVMT